MCCLVMYESMVFIHTYVFTVVISLGLHDDVHTKYNHKHFSAQFDLELCGDFVSLCTMGPSTSAQRFVFAIKIFQRDVGTLTRKLKVIRPR